MLFLLDSLLIQLDFTDSGVSDQLKLLFQGWQSQTQLAGQFPATGTSRNQEPDCRFDLIICDSPPPLPEEKLIFQEESHLMPPDSGFVSIFQVSDGNIIYFHDGASVHVTPDIYARKGEREGLPQIRARIARSLIRSGRLEDILFTGLAPFLRRRGYFLLHAFAATRSGQSVLLVGPSNSGKTTAGLSLTCDGWGYLANDVVLLKVVDGDVYALPTPGALGLSTQTVNLIPGLDPLRRQMTTGAINRKEYLPALDVVASWSTPAPVRAICFPHIDSKGIQQMKNISGAVTFARLMESSADRWDRAMLEGQVNLMQRLIEQADGYDLHVGYQVADWPELLAGKFG